MNNEKEQAACTHCHGSGYLSDGNHCQWCALPREAAQADQRVACPNCGGSQSTWKCTCDPVWSGYTRASAPQPDERAAFDPVVLTNEELNSLTKERFGNMHQRYAEGFRRLMRTAIEKNAEKSRATAPQATVKGDELRLDKPAQVGGGRFGVGVKWSTVIGAAQRHHEYMNTPEREAERIAQAQVLADFVQGRATAPQSGATLTDEQHVRARALEDAARAVEQHDRKGREWVPSSLWGAVSREAATRIRALSTQQAAIDRMWDGPGNQSAIRQPHQTAARHEQYRRAVLRAICCDIGYKAAQQIIAELAADDDTGRK